MLKLFKPTTSSRRAMIRVEKKSLSKPKIKKLLAPLAKTGGRNNYGRITTRHIGGRAKRFYRIIDFKRNKYDNIPAKVISIEYDPNRSCHIALIKYENGEHAYILAPKDLKVGDDVNSGIKDVEMRDGNCLPLKNIQIGTLVHNIEMKPGKGGQIARSAGTHARLISKNDGYAQLSMPSGSVRIVPLDCRATIGTLSNPEHQNIKIGKAGASRWRGVRPTVRGVAMNPVDHPHGGGEGKTSGGRHPVSIWGKKTKGKKTRMNKRTDKYIISKRKK